LNTGVKMLPMPKPLTEAMAPAMSDATATNAWNSNGLSNAAVRSRNHRSCRAGR
jgi:hypothetical protein